jgi:hypothetical protein
MMILINQLLALQDELDAPKNIQLTGWNQYSTRFVFAPSFTWSPVAGAARYEIRWQAGEASGTETSPEAAFSFDAAWSKIPLGRVGWSVVAFDKDDKPIGRSRAMRFFRVPDFDGKDEQALDWKAAASKNLDYILTLPKDEHTGEPMFLALAWHDPQEKGRVNFPALHYPSFAFFYLEALKHEKDTRRIEQALDSLIAAILRDRTADSGVAPRMPLSTRVIFDPNKKFQPWAEKDAITLFRTARMGEALLALYEYKKDERLKEYAEHIAATLARLQREDGSWPYRINPETGKVVEEYTSAAITIAVFLEKLGNKKYDDNLKRAVKWTLDNPCRTLRWQGMYEDIGAAKPYSNLENWDTLDAIVYFCRHNEIETAKRLNRYVEDQFVVYGPVRGVPNSKTYAPSVLEQYFCYAPMEVHTAHWIEALMALYEATGDATYKLKAKRAADAIVRAQLPEGRFSTWGRDPQTGKSPSTADWYGCNAVAGWMLYRLSEWTKK